MKHRNLIYVCSLAGFFSLFASLVAATNIIVDPLFIFGSKNYRRLNDVRFEAIRYPALSKFYSFKRIQPRTIILGSSRAEVGLDPEHPGFKLRPVYNSAFPGTAMVTAWRYFQDAVTAGRLKQAIIAVDFFFFSSRVGAVGADDDHRFVIGSDSTATPLLSRTIQHFDDLWLATLSSSTLAASWQTLIKNNGPKIMTWVQLKNGLSVLQNPRSFDQHAQFQLTERGFLTQIYGPQLCLFDEKGSSQQLDAFSATVRLAYQNGIDLRILISPSHARLWEALDQAGLWPQWELWKRALVRIVDQSAQDKSPFPLWDFSGFHEFAREQVPQSPSGPIMRWYWESSHYKKELGDLVLDQVLGYDSAEASKRPDFGVLINSSNIELHLATIRAEHLKWRATSTDANEVDEAGASYRAVREANAQCPLPQSAPQSLY